MEKNKKVMWKLAQAGVWLAGVAVAMGGFGLTAAAGIDAWQALNMKEGYGRMTRGEMVAYGVSTAGAALFIAALTVVGLIGLVAFWRFVRKEMEWR